MIPPNRRTDALQRWIARSLLAVGIACLAWSGLVALQVSVYQRQGRLALESLLATAAVREPVTAAAVTLSPGALIGSLKVHRVELSAVVVEGDDDSTLKVAVGHLPDTPLPWQDGNSALAGHRDTFFRELQGVRIGDRLSMMTPYGDFEYRVREMLVVDPADLRVLSPTEEPMLTLVTCYPFSYIGRAPKRFVVRANRL